jgi:hypothetical protein
MSFFSGFFGINSQYQIHNIFKTNLKPKDYEKN